MSAEAIRCTAWRSKALPDTYLMVAEGRGLDAVPDALLARFTHPEPVTSFLLDRERKLANADAEAVLTAIAERGYYLQLPPAGDAQMAALAARNQQLTR